MTPALFDLNIEEVLDNWEVEHALREVIANALDEQVLSGTPEVRIFKDAKGYWHIKDFGRGLRIEHFTLNENEEKLTAQSEIIGKFGVGLKDALATFHRRNVDVYIRSSCGTYSLKKTAKHGFDAITTLHVEYSDPPSGFQGTEFVLRGVTDQDIAKAKSLFARFAGEEVIEATPYGRILRRKDGVSRVYILGVFASEEPNFLFSYDITSLTESMRKRLNRERLNVGRTTYADRVKAILKNAKSDTVHDLLVEQVRRRSAGDQCDEMGWIDISQMALNLMHQQARVVYVTEEEVHWRPNVVDNARSDGYEPVIITEQQKTKLEQQADAGGPQVRTVARYVEEYNRSFQYQFVNPRELTPQEQRIYGRTQEIAALVDMRRIPDIRISQTMRVTNDDTGGVWDPSIRAIVIKRDRLSSLPEYASTLLHELGHYASGAPDSTRAFEGVLTGYLGKTATSALRR